MNNLNFLKTAIKDHKIGAVTVSSKHVVRRIVNELKFNHKFIVEYGAGDGVITKELLNRLPRDGKLVAIELNNKLFDELSKIKDDRLIPIKGDIIEISKDFSRLGLPRVDAVISGVPFTFLPPKTREVVVKNTYKGLATGGLFIVYQYSLLMGGLLRRAFDKFKFYLELRNLPPYFIMVATKK